MRIGLSLRLVPLVRAEAQIEVVPRLNLTCPVCGGPAQHRELTEEQVGYEWCACCGAPITNHDDPAYQDRWEIYEEARGEDGIALLSEAQYVDLSAAERLDYVRQALRDAAYMVQNAPTGLARRVEQMLRPFIERLRACRAQLEAETAED